MKIYERYDAWYDEEVVVMLHEDRCAIRFSLGWDLWVKTTLGWESNPFKIIGECPPVASEEEAHTYVESGEMPLSYSKLERMTNRDEKTQAVQATT